MEKHPRLRSVRAEEATPKEHEGSPEEVLQLLEGAEREIGALAEVERKRSEQMMQGLVTLGATEGTVESVRVELEKIDLEIERARDSSLGELFAKLGKYCTENVKSLGRAVLAEFIIRPIHSTYENLRRKIDRKERIHGRYFFGFEDIGKDAELLSRYPDLVDKKLEERAEEDIRKYVKILPHRIFEHTMRPFRDYGGRTEEFVDLSALYSVQLNKVKHDFDDPEKIKGTVEGYFGPSAVVYENQDLYRKRGLSRERARERGAYYVHSIVERIDAFSDYVLKDRRLSDAQKGILQDVVIDVIEHQKGDISRNIHQVKKLIKFIDLIGFSEERKTFVHASIFHILAHHKDEEGTSDCARYLGSYDINLSLGATDQGRVFAMLEKESANTKVAILKKDILSEEQKRELINQLTSNGTYEELLGDHVQDNVGIIYDLIEEAGKRGLITEDIKAAVIQKVHESLLEKRSFSWLAELQGRYEKYLSPEQNRYIKIVSRVYKSPSQTLRNLAQEVVQQLFNREVLPTESELDAELRNIEEVFVGSNIPYVGKQFRVFQILYPDRRFRESFKKISSPELLSRQSMNARRLILFKDLLKVNFRSLDGDLKKYLNILRGGSDLLSKYEANQALNEHEKLQLLRFLKKISTLADAVRAHAENHGGVDLSNIDAEISRLREDFGVREGERFIDTFNRTFLQRIGIEDIDEALRLFDTLRERTDSRNRNNAKDNKVEMENGDLVKAIPIDFFDQLLERGVLAPEFIGAETREAKYKASQSDVTPWDTDLIMYSNSFENFFSFNTVGRSTNLSVVSGYGDVMLLVKNRGQFNRTKHGEKHEDTKDDQMELFVTEVVDRTHVGIRTGFPSTEIDAVILNRASVKDGAVLDRLKYYIARKGFYIPICKESGEVIFPPEEFDRYRRIFQGIDRFGAKPVELSDAWRTTKFFEEIRSNIATREEKQEVASIRGDLMRTLQSILGELQIHVHGGALDDSIVGAQIADTGSTARGSNVEREYDFDFVIKLDEGDDSKALRIIERLKEIFPLETQYEVDSVVTARFKGVPFNGNIIDLDVSFSKKSEVSRFDADEAVAEKYQAIKDQYGEERLEEVLANIRFAKKKLMAYKSYKKGTNEDAGQQGGLGGIGVETWVLQHGGDAMRAFRAFDRAAYENGKRVSLKAFRENYKIFGAGENIRGKREPENFTKNLTEDGYRKTARLAREMVRNS